MCSNPLSQRVHPISCGCVSGLLKNKFLKRYKIKILGLEWILMYSYTRKGIINNEMSHGVENKQKTINFKINQSFTIIDKGFLKKSRISNSFQISNGEQCFKNFYIIHNNFINNKF